MEVDVKRRNQQSHREEDIHPVIVFDGVCNLCNGLVDFIIRHDPNAIFRFAALQTKAGEELRRETGVKYIDADAVMLIEGKDWTVKSDAVIRIGGILGGPWRITALFRIFPRRMRDVLYDVIAAHRYRWFGMRDSCSLPDEKTRRRFL